MPDTSLLEVSDSTRICATVEVLIGQQKVLVGHESDAFQLVNAIDAILVDRDEHLRATGLRDGSGNNFAIAGLVGGAEPAHG